MKKLYVFRHGETNWNLDGRNLGWTDEPLNDTGRIQAQKLRELSLDVIYSSPLIRAMETAQIVANGCNIPIIEHEGLKERRHGELEGIYWKDVPSEIVAKIADPDWAAPGGESNNQLAARAKTAILEIAKNAPYADIGISTHGGLAFAVIIPFLPKGTPFFKMPNCAYFTLGWNGNELSLVDMPAWLKKFP